MKIKLSKWAEMNGVKYRTAHHWIQEGLFPDEYEYSPSGSIFVKLKDDKLSSNNYIYCRVSSHTKKEDLERQVERCKAFSENAGISVEKVFKEIGSGMNDKRTQFMKLLNQPIGTIIVDNKDRLTRFGFNYIDFLYAKLGGKIIVINKDETEENDLMKDLVSVITSFCCRLYGMRRGYAKARAIKENIESK